MDTLTNDEVVIVSALRTPVGRAKRGSFKDVPPVTLLATALKGILDETQISPDEVAEIVVGNVNGFGLYRNAAFLAGFGDTTCSRVVNRCCASGLQSIADVHNSIARGDFECGIAAGVESMSLDKWVQDSELTQKHVQSNDLARDTLIPMGITSENVAEEFGISREEQDELAVMSHERAHAASQRDQPEIVPVWVEKTEPETASTLVCVEKDEGIRAGTTIEKLSKLRPCFKEGGSTTPGNASQLSDGAAAVLMMRRSKAESLGLRPMAIMRSFAVRGVPPAIMGIGPAFAIPAALKRAQLAKSEVDLYEINEAFASQCVYCVKELGLSWDNVNVNGGAIALGHPLGCTGTRMTVSLLHELERRDEKYGVVSMCVATGQGAAAVFERL